MGKPFGQSLPPGMDLNEIMKKMQQSGDLGKLFDVLDKSMMGGTGPGGAPGMPPAGFNSAQFEELLRERKKGAAASDKNVDDNTIIIAEDEPTKQVSSTATSDDNNEEDDEDLVTLTVSEARQRIQEAAKCRAEQDGIIFVDEIDKLIDAGSGTPGGGGKNYRKGEGVQKELLSLLEGTTVDTCLGPLNTAHVLFVAAGAFHQTKPTDLLPELQGRVPVRVALDPLTETDFSAILTDTESNLIAQQKALFATEDVTLNVTTCAISQIAHYTATLNRELENIGARRLRTVLATVTEELSYNAHLLTGQTVKVDAAFVDSQMEDVVKGQDLAKFIL